MEYKQGYYSKGILKDTSISVMILYIAMIVSALLQQFSGGNDYHVQLIFVLAVTFISRFTTGYTFGIAATVLSVFIVNYLFTFPYFALNFRIAGYSLSFLCMLAVSLITCTLTSRLKEQEKTLLESEKEKMRANLLRAISHDLRTPLTTIIGSITALLENKDNLPREKQEELLANSRDDAQRLVRMVENLLSITRIGNEEAAIEKKAEAVEEIISEAVGKFKKHYPDMNVTVSVPKELLLVPMDALLIEQVLTNLLYNAVLHGQFVSVIFLSVTRQNGNALFSMEDDGAGFDEKSIPYLFEGYYMKSEKNGGGDNWRNMGIGLSSCMSIVKAHGGNMTAGNLPKGGAVIQFRLPLEADKKWRP